MTALSNAGSIAARILELAFDAGRSDMTQMKLHKLVTLAQSLSEYALGSPAFNERVVALTHGPAVSGLLDVYKAHGKDPIAQIQRAGTASLDDAGEQIVHEVWDVAGGIAPGGLWTLTHKVGPWEHYHEMGNATEIPAAALGTAWPSYVALADQLTQYRSPHNTRVIGLGQSGFRSRAEQDEAIAQFRPSRLRAGA